LSDEQGWIDSARQGNAGAWERLVQAYQQPVFRLAYLLLGDADEAEDIAQETFIRAHAALDRFDPHRPLRPWLMRIASNLSRNRRRSLGRYLAALQQAFRNETPPGTAVQQAHASLESEDLWKAVRRLRKEDQQIIYLRYFLEVPEAEAAEVLGIAQGTVKSRHHRAIARLREVLLKEFPYMLQEGLDGS